MDNKDSNIEELEEQEIENIDSSDSNDVDDSYIDDAQPQYYEQPSYTNNNYSPMSNNSNQINHKHRNTNPNNDNLAKGFKSNKNV